MRSSFKRIGSYVQQVNARNNGLSVTNLQGVSINKLFMPSVANINGTDLSKYKVVSKEQFAFNPMHVGRDEVLPIGMLETDAPIIVSPAYIVFEIIDKKELLPEYLMMWCRRPEFDRNAWFTTDSSVRGGFSWNDFCEMTLPVPLPDKQQEIVKEYTTIVDRIKLNEQQNQKLEETAQAIYKRWFVDFEFPFSAEYATAVGKPKLEGQPYKPSCGEMVYSETLEHEIPKGWKESSLGAEIEYKKGFAFKSSDYKSGGVRIVRVSNFEGDSINISNCNHIDEIKAKEYEQFRLKISDIIISTVGSWPNNPDSVVGKVIKVPAFAKDSLLNQNAVRLRARRKSLQLLIYYALSNENYSSYVISGAQGSANQASVTLDHLFAFKLILPDSSIEERFCATINKLCKYKSDFENETFHLSKLRDIVLVGIAQKGAS